MSNYKGWTLTWPLIMLLFGGCGSPVDTPTANSDTVQSGNTKETEIATMKLSSASLHDGGTIPPKYTGVGQDISPPLAWSNVPEGTQSFALICDDPDAPSPKHPRPEGPWVHWVLYNIPANVTELPEAVPRKSAPDQPAGARQGQNDFGRHNVGYRGPMPPKGSGPHRYFFKIYALDRPLDLASTCANKKSLLATMQGHILAQGQLVGLFERP